jgi:uncharacterized protein with HEPN domain
MPPSLADRVAHVLEAINDIQSALATHSLPSFADDKIIRLAVERWLEIISEASRHIPADVKAAAPDIDWIGMAALGNRLRHAYHLVDVELLWNIVERDLPPLKAFIERTVRETNR